MPGANKEARDIHRSHGSYKPYFLLSPVKLRCANPFDKFQLGLRQLLDDLIVQRMAENDKIVTRYMDDKEFGDAAFTVLSKAIYDSIPTDAGASTPG